MKYVLVIVGLVIAVNSNAQYNYVPNASFEMMDSCPDWDGQLQRLKQWYNPTFNTPDFFDSCSNYIQDAISGVPSNWCGWQQARTGSAYAGFASKLQTNREYIGVKLKQDLMADSTYCVKAWVSKAENFRFAIGCIGFYFSQLKLDVGNDSDFINVFNVTPQ